MSWIFILVVILLVGLLVGAAMKFGPRLNIDPDYLNLFKWFAFVGTIIWLFFATGAYNWLVSLGGPGRTFRR